MISITLTYRRKELENKDSREFQEISSTIKDGLAQALRNEQVPILKTFSFPSLMLQQHKLVCFSLEINVPVCL
jgi:hypothetical protein